jgi:hypothetical protein
VALRELADVVAELALEESDGVVSVHGDESEMREVEEAAVAADARCRLGEAGDPVRIDSSGGGGEMVSPNWMHAVYLGLESGRPHDAASTRGRFRYHNQRYRENRARQGSIAQGRFRMLQWRSHQLVDISSQSAGQ